MKYICHLLLYILLFKPELYAWDKEKTVQKIKEAQQTIIKIDNNLKLRPYIPFDIYSDALIDLLLSRTEFKFENFVKSYYHASQSIIKLQTIEQLAEARFYRNKLLIMERDYYKKNQSNTGFSSILDASLQKKGEVYHTQLLDKKIFIRRTHKLSTKGRERLNKVAAVLKQFPQSSVKIVGHTRYHDYKHKSAFKARLVSEYLSDQGIESSRISYTGLGNKEVMETPFGYKRVNRVEIIIIGIEL